MSCSQCGHHNPVGTKFCAECGARLALVCTACGTANPAGNKFCGECGSPLGQPLAPKSQITSKFASPETYTPRHLAERILSSKSALEGERKLVTVLFADLKGSMELLADRDPEEARKVLDPVLERMTEAVHRYEGTVNQVMGDGIMALFGAPIGHEDHAVRACYAALRMQRRVNLYADELQRGGDTPVQIRVGLNSGEVVVGSIGSDLHMDYTAVGQTTHLAARMEQMAKPGSALVTGETLKLAEGYVQVRPLGAVTVRGLETPTPVYELTGIVPAGSRFQASAARGLTRFVGRESELEQLAQALERAAAGHGQTVAVVGEAGVGKSRLVWEFMRSHRTHGWLMLESGSVSYGKATLYLPVIELLKSYFKIQDRDDQREIRERVAGKLLMLDRALEPLLTPLLGLLDVPVDDEVWNALDPPQRRQRTLDAVKRLLLRESQVQPLLLLFEDLHWIDAETQSLLDSLIESLPTSRVLLLVNYRPEYEHTWGRKTSYLQLRIDPLPPESAEELLKALLGEDQTLEPLKRLLIEGTEGNPFFLEESVRALVETAALLGERGGYQLARPLPTIQVPATVQAVLAARIDRLPPGDKALLQLASVVGKDVPFVLLRTIAEPAEDELRVALGRLQAAEFLYEASLFPDLEYTFKHALTHEVAYGSLLQERRRAVHAQLVETFEMRYPDRVAEQIDRLAHHALRGQVWDKAVTYLTQAGAKAFAQSAHREAADRFEQSLTALSHLPEDPERLELGFDIQLNLRHALFQLAEPDRLLQCLNTAETIAERLADRYRLSLVAVFKANYLWWIGEPDRGLEAHKHAIALGWPGIRFVQGQCYHALGEYRQAALSLTETADLLSGDHIRDRGIYSGFPSVFARTDLAWSLAELGEMEEATRRAGEAVHIAELLDHPFSLVLAYCESGRLSLFKGDLHKAVIALECALRTGGLANLPFWFPWVASSLGYAYALSGRSAEGVQLLEEGLERATVTRFLFGQSLRAAWLGEAYLRSGRMEDAARQAGHALALARTHRERGFEAWALRLLGEIAAHHHPGDPAKAENYYSQAMGLADKLEMRPLVAHCHIGLGKLYHAYDRAKAEKHLTTAATMYREMGVGFWLAQAEAALKQPGPKAGR